jgi:hypothetical protein
VSSIFLKLKIQIKTKIFGIYGRKSQQGGIKRRGEKANYLAIFFKK